MNYKPHIDVDVAPSMASRPIVSAFAAQYKSVDGCTAHLSQSSYFSYFRNSSGQFSSTNPRITFVGDLKRLKQFYVHFCNLNFRRNFSYFNLCLALLVFVDHDTFLRVCGFNFEDAFCTRVRPRRSYHSFNLPDASQPVVSGFFKVIDPVMNCLPLQSALFDPILIPLVLLIIVWMIF